MTDETQTPTAERSRRFGARDAVVCVLVAAAALVLLAGDGIRRAGEEMDRGIVRSVVLAVGHPAGWIADQLPFADAADQVTGWLSSDQDLGATDGSFGGISTAGATGTSRVAPTAFAPQELGRQATLSPLRTLLVTGDSLSQPLDAELARGLASSGVRTKREPHIGTGLSKPDIVDWGKLAIKQSREVRPDAVIVFIGANEGFPMPTPTGDSPCCAADWAAEYATRARAMMQAYRRNGTTQVYWLLLPLPRDRERQRISLAVNAAIRVAAGPFGAEVRVIDTERIFTPGRRYRDAMVIAGRRQIVREPDGIHLNARGARLAASILRAQLAARFKL